MSTQELIFLNYLSKVFENLDDAIVLCELQDGKLEPVMVNHGFYAMTGYTKTDDLSKIGETIAADDRNGKLLAKSYDAIKKREISRETTTTTAPKGEISLCIKLIPIFNSLGEATHFVFIARDITADVAKDALIKDLKSRLKNQ